MASKVVLITGVADYWGARLAERLATKPGIHVLGLDAQTPKERADGLDFVQADVRNPLFADLLKSEQVHTVCHLKFLHSVQPSEAVFNLNVIGTRMLLDACAEAGVSKVVLKSSTAVYGAHPNNSALLTEADMVRGSPRYSYTRHLVDIENFCADFVRQAPQLMLTVLRCASIVGTTADTPMTRYLRNRWAPTLLGFDPMLQILHEDDVVRSLAYAALNHRPGTYNVAAEGVLPLAKIMALTDTLPLPILHSLAYWGMKLWDGGGRDLDGLWPIEPDYLRYSWVGDLTRMREELGFVPDYTAEEALREFAVQKRSRDLRLPGDALAADEQHMRATIERRRRAQHGQAPDVVKGDEDE
jgi:UDP-glucose 4-epimerase